MRILIVAGGPRDGHSGYRHRTLQMASELARQNHSVWLLWYFPLYRLFKPHDLRHYTAFKTIGIPALPFFFHPLVSPLARVLCRMFTKLVLCLLRCDAVQFEGVLGIVTGIPSTKIIIDCHGDPLEEHILNGFSPWKLRQARRDYARAISKADGIVTVSERLREKLLDAAKDRHPASVVAPCGVDLKTFGTHGKVRDAIRRELGMEQRIVFCYLGGLQNYQCVPETLRLLAKLRSIDPRIALLLLTEENTAAFSSELAAIGEMGRDVICRSASHGEVPRLLGAADIGLLLRAETEVNAVSSPTKCGEYLAAGVPVLTTQYAGDAPAIIRAEQCGMVLLQPLPSAEEIRNIIDLIESVNSCRTTWAERCQSAAARHRSWDVSGCAVQRLYAEVSRVGAEHPRAASQTTSTY